jgi:hypothetical protein
MPRDSRKRFDPLSPLRQVEIRQAKTAGFDSNQSFLGAEIRKRTIPIMERAVVFDDLNGLHG